MKGWFNKLFGGRKAPKQSPKVELSKLAISNIEEFVRFPTLENKALAVKSYMDAVERFKTARGTVHMDFMAEVTNPVPDTSEIVRTRNILKAHMGLED